MSSFRQVTGKIAPQAGTGICARAFFYLMSLAVFSAAMIETANAQQATTLRPGLDTASDRATNATNQQPVNITAPVQQTNAPRPIRLLTNQPPAPPPPPTTTPRRTRQVDPFAPLGLRVGSFRLFPVLETTGVFTDNVRTTNTNKRADYGLRLAPSLVLQSDWARHSLTFNAASEHIFFPRTKEFNAHELNLSASSRIDIRRTTNLSTTASYALSQTSNASSEVPGTAIGNRRDHTFTATSALTHRAGRLVGTLTGGASWYRFDNVKLAGGGVENNADREYVAPIATLRLGYETSGAVTPYIQAGYAPRFHRQRLDRNNIARNSQGYTAQAGVTFNFSPIWGGDVAFTYEHRNYDDPTLANINAFGVNATINWRPSALTTLTLVASTNVDESATPGNAATTSHDIALNIAHRFRENITGTFGAGFNYDDFANTGADDMYFTIRTGIAYAMNRKIEWIADYQMTHFKSGSGTGDYTENRITAGLRFKL